MLRFIIARQTFDGMEFHGNTMETLDCDAPELEKVLTRGGYGGGPNCDSFDSSHVIGVEVLRVSDDPAAPKG